MAADKATCHVCGQSVCRINGRIGMHTRRVGGETDTNYLKPQHELCPGSK